MYAPSALDFDGTNDYLTRGAGLTGAADGKVGLFSCWVRLDGGDAAHRYILQSAGSYYVVSRHSNNKLQLFARNSTSTTILHQFSVGTYTTSTTWLNLLISWDLGNSKADIYVNDVSVGDTPIALTDNDIDYTRTDWAVGSQTTGASFFNGALAELYFALEYLDISVESNRRKFITAALKPEDLGSDGSTPTGTAPIIYMKFAPGATATNSGTGRNFTATGAPAPAIGPVTPRQARARGAPRSRRN